MTLITLLYSCLLTPCGCRDVDRCRCVVCAVVPASQELCPNPQRTGPTQRLDPSNLSDDERTERERKRENKNRFRTCTKKLLKTVCTAAQSNDLMFILVIKRSLPKALSFLMEGNIHSHCFEQKCIQINEVNLKFKHEFIILINCVFLLKCGGRKVTKRGNYALKCCNFGRFLVNVANL